MNNVLKVMFACTCIALSAATFGGPRLDEILGSPKPTQTFFVAAATCPAPLAAPSDVRPATMLLNGAFAKMRAVLKRPIPANLNSVELAKRIDARTGALREELAQIAGMTARVSFVVVDIVDRPRPIPPVLRNPSAAAIQQFEADRRAYEALIAEIDKRPRVAIGEMTLADEIEPKATKVDRGSNATDARVNKINREIATLRLQLQNEHDEDQRILLNRSMKRLVDERTRLAVVSEPRPKSVEVASGSDDYVYIFAPAGRLDAWRKDHRKSVVAFFEQVQLDTDGEFQLDARCTLLEGADAQEAVEAEPTTAPGI